MEEERKVRRKNKSYSTTYRGTSKESEKMGTRYTKTPNLHKLPPIGTRVIVRHKEVFDRALGDDRTGTGWRIQSNFYDAFHRPAIFVVIDYSKGIENPLDASNDVILEREVRGCVLRERVRTIYVASGSIQLLEV